MRISFFTLQIEDSIITKGLVELANALVPDHEVEIVTGNKFGERELYGISPRVMIKYLVKDSHEDPDRFNLRHGRKQNLLTPFTRPFLRSNLRKESRRRMIAAISVSKGNVLVSGDPVLNELLTRYAYVRPIKVALGDDMSKMEERQKNALIGSLRGFDYFVPINGDIPCDDAAKLGNMGVSTKLLGTEDPLGDWRTFMNEIEVKARRQY